MSLPNRYHETRFFADPRREILWRCLWKYYFSRYVHPSDTVLELGSGYSDFINNVQAKRRIAVDMWPDFLSHLREGVEGYVRDVSDLGFLADRSINLVFASNVVEHLTREKFEEVLNQLTQKLVPGGKIILLQPNYYYAFREYFDDYTHLTVYSHVSLCDFLMARGFEILRCVPRFVPLTLKSRFKVWPALIWLYLHCPLKPFGKQMLVVARPI